MDWSATIDAYCERTEAAFWAEPVNAATNAAFLVAAIVMWRRTAGLPLGRGLSAILGIIGAGSFLFHTFATRWAGAADVVPILVFILAYLFTANLHYWRMPGWAAALAAAAFIPFAQVVTPWLAHVPLLGRSAAYLPVPILILLYAAGLAGRAPATARGLALGAAILLVSLTARSADALVCQRFPLGTHFLWHLLNALMLGWMIEVYRRHMLADPPHRR